MTEKKETHSHPAIRGRSTISQITPVPAITTRTPCLITGDDGSVSIPVVPDPEPGMVQDISTKTEIDISRLVTCIIVNFKTYDLVRNTLTTFRKFYPSVTIYLVDNGSHDKSTRYIRKSGAKIENVVSVIHNENIGHGPAMHEAIMACDTDYIFTLDSDCIVHNGGFLEKMIDRITERETIYSTGWLRYVDPITGVSTSDTTKSLKYIHPSAALYDRKKYLDLPPFSHSGAPCTLNMLGARNAGYEVCSFPIEGYIEHLIAGTRRMYGGKWDPKTDEKPGPWNKDTHLPI